MSATTELQVLDIAPGIPNFAPSIHPGAVEAKRMALEAVQALETVASQDEYESAIEAQRRCKTLSKLAEDSRTELKRPILEAGRAIDAQAKAYCQDLDAAADKLGRMAAAYQERLREEARKAREAAEEAERKRLLELSAEQMKINIDPDLDPEEAQRRMVEAQDKAVEDITQTRMQAAQAPSTAAGTMLRKDWKFEVTDINALHRAHPELCTISPNNAAIRAVIKNRELPGVRRWQESKVSVRTDATPARAVLDAYDY